MRLDLGELACQHTPLEVLENGETDLSSVRTSHDDTIPFSLCSQYKGGSRSLGDLSSSPQVKHGDTDHTDLPISSSHHTVVQ